MCEDLSYPITHESSKPRPGILHGPFLQRNCLGNKIGKNLPLSVIPPGAEIHLFAIVLDSRWSSPRT